MYSIILRYIIRLAIDRSIVCAAVSSKKVFVAAVAEVVLAAWSIRSLVPSVRKFHRSFAQSRHQRGSSGGGVTDYRWEPEAEVGAQQGGATATTQAEAE